VFFLLFKRNKKEKALRVVLFYVVYCIINEFTNFYLQSLHSSFVIILFALFTVAEFSFFCYFLYLIIQKSVKRVVLFTWVGFLFFAFADYFFFSKGQEFDSFAIGIESIIILLLCVYYLFTQLKMSNNLLIYSTFNFWIIIAFLIYFSGTFFLYIMTESMRENIAFQKQYFIINISFNILKNILLCVAMTMKLNHAVNQQKPAIPELDDDLFIQTNTNQQN